jgi:hypothetical protein
MFHIFFVSLGWLGGRQTSTTYTAPLHSVRYGIILWDGICNPNPSLDTHKNNNS